MSEVVQIEQGKDAGAYAVIIDETIDAVFLRDLCRREAQKQHDRLPKITQRMAVKKARHKYEVFAKYADRFEEIRLDVVKQFVERNKVE